MVMDEMYCLVVSHRKLSVIKYKRVLRYRVVKPDPSRLTKKTTRKDPSQYVDVSRSLN